MKITTQQGARQGDDNTLKQKYSDKKQGSNHMRNTCHFFLNHLNWVHFLCIFTISIFYVL